MNKKTRDYKRQDRRVAQTVKYFKVDLGYDNWYDYWHMHLDMRGYTVNQPKRRKKYMAYYLQLLDKVETHASGKPFQVWIHVSEEGRDDALFLHTQNPDADFPYKSDDIAWDETLPDWLQGMIDPKLYRYIKLMHYDFCFIQKRGLGIPIWNEDGPQESYLGRADCGKPVL